VHNGIVHFFAGAEEIKGSTLERTASPASKAFNESRLRRRCHLVYLTKNGRLSSGPRDDFQGEGAHFSASAPGARETLETSGDVGNPLSCFVLSCVSVCPGCDIGVLCPNDWMDQNNTWHGGRPQPWLHCVRWGPSSSSPKGTQPPNFRPVSVVATRLDGSTCHLVWR